MNTYKVNSHKIDTFFVYQTKILPKKPVKRTQDMIKKLFSCMEYWYFSLKLLLGTIFVLFSTLPITFLHFSSPNPQIFPVQKNCTRPKFLVHIQPLE